MCRFAGRRASRPVSLIPSALKKLGDAVLEPALGRDQLAAHPVYVADQILADLAFVDGEDRIASKLAPDDLPNLAHRQYVRTGDVDPGAALQIESGLDRARGVTGVDRIDPNPVVPLKADRIAGGDIVDQPGDQHRPFLAGAVG